MNQLEVRSYRGALPEAYRTLMPRELQPLMQELPASFAALGAMLDGRPVALVVASLHAAAGPGMAKTAKLRSIRVAGPYRRKGIGRRLLGMLENLLLQNGANEMHTEYVGEMEPDSETAAFLRNCGFAEPARGIHIWSGPLGEVFEDLPRIKQLGIPDGFTVESLSSLHAEERACIARGKGDWYPPLLDPFAEESLIDPERSLVLRYRKEPVGWVILEAFDDRTVLIKSMFVKDRHQRLARGIALTAEATRRILEEGRFTEAILFVEAENDAMTRFLHRQIDHPAIRKEILWRTVKFL
ncbi:GNAT family N-acetyltransferase [Paenibacillus sp. DYY-L-2]|uniref:GNAT family N-acetyltransferase n=1 Tax=Paenibacillus sp. DYY-L-2 TaxID=3447013 RepID=UPI003F4F4D3A